MPTKKGSIPWNKGLRREKTLTCKHCSAKFWRSPSRVKRSYCSPKCWASSTERFVLMSNAHKGKKRPTEWVRKMSESLKKIPPRFGKNAPNWRGGITPLHQKIRNSREHWQWSTDVKKRDGKCLHCGACKDLIAHHIKSFSKYPEERFLLENGMTLCRSCHAKLHKKCISEKKPSKHSKKNTVGLHMAKNIVKISSLGGL